MALRLVRGVAQRDDPIATDLFDGFTADTQFLSMPHTRKWYREEHIFSEIIDRDTYDYWVSLGKKNSAERAKDKVKEILQEDIPSTLNADVQTELQNIMLADAKRNGVDKLP
jgi:trimethylamine--corrinoid protein Co-methyltransferase